MVRLDLLARKVTRAAARLDDAQRLLDSARKAFTGDAKSRDLTSFYLFLAIQECIDIAAHWIADAGWPPPDGSAASFDVLADRNVIERSLADGMRAATGLRNRIAHGYADVDHGRLYDEARDGVTTLRHFLAAVAEAAGLGDE